MPGKKPTNGKARRPGRAISPVWKRWDKERKTLSRTRAGFSKANGYGDDKWIKSMRDYYTRRLEAHKAAEPPKYLED